jgi:osmotically-inducible protein OsmY
MRAGINRKRWWAPFTMIALGASLAFFFDPHNGKRRRRMLRDRPLALARRSERQAEQVAHRGVAKTHALAARARRLTHRTSYDDVTLAHKVESEIFRFRDIPKRDLNIEAVDGIVTIRGQVNGPETIEEIVEKTRKVRGVQGVENLMHLPGTEAPHHQPNGHF